MAKNTPKSDRNLVIYSVFVRNYSEEGTFEEVRRDLPRIKDLGVDVIWFMPIQPIGEKSRKGTMGSPYAIRDYRGVSPDLGTVADFRRLTDDIRALGMKSMLDVVYNHTSPDSWLAENHPEWFYRKADGAMGNRVGDWWDIVDLDYTDPALWDYQIDTLKYWAEMVDGFRCDVAPLVPLDFWQRARREVETVRPGCIWLAESVEPIFIKLTRAAGIPSLSDSEIYQAFDLAYDYDIFDVFKNYVAGKAPLSEYARAVNGQEIIYPDNYVKLRFLENHDNLRAKFIIPDRTALINWTAFLYFQKGATLLFAGQERSAAHLPELFEKDPVDWSGEDLTPLMKRLYQLKKRPLLADSAYEVKALPGDVMLATHTRGKSRLVGVFSLRGEKGPVAVDVPDGTYENLALGGTVEVKRGTVSCAGLPVIFDPGLCE